jgi:hypothetical protein
MISITLLPLLYLILINLPISGFCVKGDQFFLARTDEVTTKYMLLATRI